MTNAKAYYIIIKEYLKTKGIVFSSKNRAHVAVYRRNLKAAKELLECADDSVEAAVTGITRVARWAKSRRLDYSLETVVKRWLDDNTPMQRPYIVEHGKRYELRHKDGEWYVLDKGKWYKYSGKKSDIKYEQ